jgi:VWFA-related protein
MSLGMPVGTLDALDEPGPYARGAGEGAAGDQIFGSRGLPNTATLEVGMSRQSFLTMSALVLTGVAALGAQAPPPAAEVPEFAVGTELVRIDVVVTDENDRPVSSLRRDDFVVLEDGHPQEIAHFEVYAHGAPVFGVAAPPSPATASGEEIEGYRRRHIVFAIDDLHIGPGNLSHAKKAMLDFVDQQLGPDDRVALVTTSGAVGLYQGFTNDPSALRLAISRIVPRLPQTNWTGPPQITVYQAERIERGDPLALEMAVQEVLREEPSGADPEDAARRAMIRARGVRAESAYLVRSTLETLHGVMRGLAELPGRKVIVLVSDGFLVGLGTANSQAFDLRRITDAGTRAGVVLYALDTRGLVATPPIGNASIRGAPSAIAPGVREAMARQSEEAVRDGMHGLAKDTGGFLVHSTNDIGRGLHQILRDTETYYLLAYQPTNTRRDGRFRKIEVRLPDRRDLKVRTRRGYFAPDESEDRKPGPPPEPEDAGVRTARELHAALGSLYPRSEIPLRLSADFVSMGSAGPQLVVSGHVDLGAVRFERVDDRYLADVDVAGVVYDEAGTPFAELEPQRISLRLTPAEYEQARKAGLKYHKVLAVTPGSYEVRLAVREGDEGRLGSATRRIQIPDVGEGQLTLSGLFLLRAGAHGSGELISGPGSAGSPLDVQAFPRFERNDDLYYQLQVLNPRKDASGETRLTIQAEILEGDHLLASTPETTVALSQMGAVPQAYTGRIQLRPLPPGAYELRVAVTDHLGRSTVQRYAGFDVEQ